MFPLTVFDTETPGFAQPGIMQIAAVRIDEKFNILNSFATYIQPELWTEIEPGAFNAHGISREDCEAHGIPLASALAILKCFLSMSQTAVCHNWAYDSKVVSKTLTLLGKEDFLSRQKFFCTMKALTPICQLPGSRGYKWPKLQEAHQHLFGEGFEDAHDAMADVMATVRVLRGITEKHPELLRAA